MDSPGSDKENVENNNNFSERTDQERKLYYRELLNQIETIEESEDLGINTAHQLGTILNSVNELGLDDTVCHPDETILDSKVLSAASNLLVKCIQAVDVSTDTYSPKEFTEKIMCYTLEDDEAEYEPENLSSFLNIANDIIPEVPVFGCVYGAYDLTDLPKPKQKKERVKQQKEQFQKKEPEKVSNVEKEEKGIEEIVKFFFEVLEKSSKENKDRAVKYFDFVIDTDSFATTIENMFYCSFLIRDGKAHLDINSSGDPFIKPVRKRNLLEFRQKEGVNTQIIPSMTYDKWETFRTVGLLQKYKNMKKPQ